jgi:hypothetical protein
MISRGETNMQCPASARRRGAQMVALGVAQLLLLLAAALANSACPPGGEVHLHVQPTVASAAAGATARPLIVDGPCPAQLFSSVHAAQSALRRGHGAGRPRVVSLLGGDHHLPVPLELDRRDSGSVGAPIVWRSAPGQRARMTGGTAVPVSAFGPTVLPSGAVGALRADLTALGLNSSVMGAMASPHPVALAELFVGGAPATLAREPNLDIDRDQTWRYYGYENLTAPSSTGFTLADAPVVAKLRSALAQDGSLWLHGYVSGRMRANLQHARWSFSRLIILDSDCELID